MKEDKQSYYVDIANGEVLQERIDGSPNFRIYANEEELADLRGWFRANYNDDLKTFSRSHVPFLEPSKDSQNDKYEHSMNEIYKMIYDLGDEEARNFIEEQNLLISYNENDRDDIERMKE
ncbi:hypothetical protein [Peribacillus kribbensis]|uniref:hypothetical protein n=1 Tax=Peribacillus kribbensis TaxID=356658 RepID=UPI00041263E1|nr:hypothetical protein [Peribacillus kribbensis]